jgi:hypothetical protein
LVPQASAAATYGRAISDRQKCSRQLRNLNVDTFRIAALRETPSVWVCTDFIHPLIGFGCEPF